MVPPLLIACTGVYGGCSLVHALSFPPSPSTAWAPRIPERPPLDAATGLRWARLLADLRASGRSMPIKNSMIAATALVHGLPLATLNRRDFDKAGVEIVDPFA